MHVTSNHITVERHLRYFLSGEPGPETRSVTFVLHGYGHHPGYFIKWFDSVASEKHLVIAPEGLSRFYNQGINGRVGASWMTSDDRETDILDYQNFLNKLVKMIRSKVQANCKIQIIGFSQGAATACRWVTSGEVKPDRVFLWAGMFPPDLEHDGDPKHLNETEVIQVLSEQDPYFDQGMLQNQNSYLEDLGVKSTTHWYEGDHKVVEDDLKEVYSKYVPWWSDLF